MQGMWGRTSRDRNSRLQIQKLMPNKSIPKTSNKKSHGGRPTIYTQEYLEALAAEMIVWFKKKPNWWLKDFAIQHGFAPQRFSEFVKVSTAFSEALSYCNAIQESKLVKKGYQPYKDRFTQFLLKNVCGYRDDKALSIGPGGTSEDGFDSVSITITQSKTRTNGHNGNGHTD